VCYNPTNLRFDFGQNFGCSKFWPEILLKVSKTKWKNLLVQAISTSKNLAPNFSK